MMSLRLLQKVFVAHVISIWKCFSHSGTLDNVEGGKHESVSPKVIQERLIMWREVNTSLSPQNLVGVRFVE